MKTYAPKPKQKQFLEEEEEAGLPDWILKMTPEEREQQMEAWRRQVGIKKEEQGGQKTEPIQENKSTKTNTDKLTTALKEIDAYGELNSVEKRLNTSFLNSLSALGEFELLKIDTAHRVKALKHLSEFVYLGGDAEECVVMLLDKVPVGEENAVLRNMISSRRFITFEDKIQGDNYKAYHLAVRRLYLSAKSLEQAEKEISAITGAGDPKHPKTMERFAKEDHLFWWLDSGFVNKIVHHGHWVDYSNMTFTKEGQLSFDMQYWHGVGADPQAHIELDPFTMVGVIFKSASQGLDFNASEEIKYMPALNLFALYTEQWNAEAMRAVDTSLLIAGGIGMLSKTTRLGKLVALLDVSLGAAAIVINELRPKISDTEEGKQFLKVWDTVNGLIGIYGLAKVISHLPQVFTKLKETYKALRKKPNPKINQSELNEIDTEVNKLLNNADELKIEQIKNATKEERVKALGNDPKKGFQKHEGEVGQMIEEKYGYFERYHNADVEWVSLSGPNKGKSFDLLGLPEGISKYHGDDMKKFLPSIDIHFGKADIVVLDYRYMSSAQKTSVKQYIKNKFSSQLNRLIELE